MLRFCLVNTGAILQLRLPSESDTEKMIQGAVVMKELNFVLSAHPPSKMMLVVLQFSEERWFVLSRPSRSNLAFFWRKRLSNRISQRVKAEGSVAKPQQSKSLMTP